MSEDIRIVEEDQMEAAEQEEQAAAFSLAKQLVVEAGMPVCPVLNRSPEEVAKYGVGSDVLPLIRPVVGSRREADRVPAAFRTADARKTAFLAKYRQTNQQFFAKWSK